MTSKLMAGEPDSTYVANTTAGEDAGTVNTTSSTVASVMVSSAYLEIQNVY